jgi:hypothetical protein
MKRRKTKNKSNLSLLERLPVELLQIVFLESMNVRLPLVSITIAAKLSSAHLRLGLTNRMICTDIEKCSQRDRSRLIACRFFTFDFLCGYLQHVHNSWIQIRDAGDHLKFNSPFPQHNKTITLEELSRILVNPADVAWVGLAQAFNGLNIPEKLLHGPWTDDKNRFFGFLIEAGCTIDWNSTAGEVAVNAVYTAVRENDEETVERLVRPTEGMVKPKHAMLRCAVLEANCKRAIIRRLLLIDCDKSIFDFLDPDLWAWIEIQKQTKKENDALWLQKVLEHQGHWFKVEVEMVNIS